MCTSKAAAGAAGARQRVASKSRGWAAFVCLCACLPALPGARPAGAQDAAFSLPPGAHGAPFFASFVVADPEGASSSPSPDAQAAPASPPGVQGTTTSPPGAPGGTSPLPQGTTGATPAAAPGQDQPEEGAGKKTGLQITLNGSLTQAYARALDRTFLGIPKAGTADYRTAAVQIRFDLGAQDSFSLKLGHERLGDSPIAEAESNVSVDWLFYEHRFAFGALRVGRVKFPFGIYNEVRDVGTLLPFYRPSTDFYGTGSFTTEEIDGAAFSHSFDLGRGWQLDADVFGGNWEFFTLSPELGLSTGKARNTLGAEAWLGTPLPGLRVGAGGMRYRVFIASGIPTESGETDHASLEWEHGRLAAHVEYKYRRQADATNPAGYAHLGVRLTDRITVNGEVDYSDISIKEFKHKIQVDRDRVLGVNYAFRPELVAKGEFHWDKGYAQDAFPDFSLPPQTNRFWIVSLSVSF
jgi:hypothetical protein